MKKLSFGAAIAVLFLHTAAFAQQPAPSQPAQPAPTAPPATSAPTPSPTPPPAPPAAPQPYPQQYPPQPYPPQYPPQPYPPQPYPAQPYPAQPYPPPPPAPPQQPAPPVYPYGPPPGYRPPAPYYYYPPPAAHRGLYRPFSLSAGLGGGSLSIPEFDGGHDNESGYSFLVRIGFGLAPNFQVFLGIDGMGISEPANDLTVTDYLIGVQYFLIPRLYLRGGVGIASATISDGYFSDSTAGQGFLGGIGLELAQGDNVSFGVEFNSAASRFSAGTYFANGLSFILSFY